MGGFNGSLQHTRLYYEHGPSLNDAAMRIPMIFAGPGIGRGVDTDVAQIHDVTPTLLSLTNVPKSNWPPMDGVDLSSRLGGHRLPDFSPRAEIAFSESSSATQIYLMQYIATGLARRENCTHGEKFSLCQTTEGEF